MVTTSFEIAEEQIRDKRRYVSYDLREFTIEYIVNKFNNKEVYIPEYQREFVWDITKKSKLIESVILGLPIPYIYIADVRENDKEAEDEGNLEIVDGVQRISTLVSFMSDDFILTGLTELTALNGMKYSDFSITRKRRFYNTPLKFVFISEDSDADVRFMMFERINTGGVNLNSIEQKRGIYQGEFMDFIYNECAKNPLFVGLTSFTEKVKMRREAEELILRFFAYSEKYNEYNGNAQEFLDNYVKEKTQSFNKEELEERFELMLQFVKKFFPFGFRKNRDSQKTPRLRFEAISVGSYLALNENPALMQKTTEQIDTSWINSKDFIDRISGASTSSKAKLLDRLNFVKNKLLNINE